MKSKKLITSILALSMLTSTAFQTFAAESNEVIDPLPVTGTTSVTLEVKDTDSGDPPVDPPIDPSDILIATVPVELPIVMDLESNITVPTGAKIINHVEGKGIKVSEINATLSSGWSAAAYTDDFTAKADNTKELGLSFRSDTMDTTGTFSLTADNWNIAANSSLPLNMAAKLPKHTETSKTKIATIGFTIDWSGTTEGSDPTPPPNPGTEKVTVTFTADGNGTLAGETTVSIKKGETAPFPTANPSSIRYELSNWVDTSTNSEVEPTAPIMEDTTIKAVFDAKADSPKNWFAATNGSITGLSDEYLNTVDAPTDLVIPNNIGGSTIKSIGSNAFSKKDLITSVVIPNTVTSIGSNAFAGCSSITELNLDYSYANKILNAPFGLPKNKIRWAPAETWDTNPLSSQEIVSLGLQFDKSTGAIKARDTNAPIGNISLPTSVDGVKVTSLSYRAFRGCSRLTGITIPGSVTSIGDYYFEDCTSLNSVTILDGVTSIGTGAFESCYKLTSITIPDTVTSIGSSAFKGCSSLSNIILPNSVTVLRGDAFNGCVSLTNITISESLTGIDSFTFKGCTRLTSITIPDSITGIGGSAFEGCTNLTDITIPDSVTYIGDSAFKSVPHITYHGTATGSPWGAKSIN